MEKNIKEISNNLEQYELSANGNNCVGPCYSQGKITLHPIGIKTISKLEYNYCPIREMETITKQTKIIDKCSKITEQDILFTDILFPKLDFSDGAFLLIYYGIKSMNDTVIWIQNNNKKMLTNIRLLDCSWRAYGYDLTYISDGLAEIYINFLLTVWNKNYPSEPYNKITEMQNLLMSYILNYKHKWRKIQNHTNKIKKFILLKLN